MGRGREGGGRDPGVAGPRLGKRSFFCSRPPGPRLMSLSGGSQRPLRVFPAWAVPAVLGDAAGFVGSVGFTASARRMTSLYPFRTASDASRGRGWERRHPAVACMLTRARRASSQ